MAWNETLSPEQGSFADAARRALQPLRTRLSNVHEAEKDTGEALAEVWKCLSEIGWFGCLIPEEFGGNERGMVAMAIAYEELAKQGILTTFPVLTAFEYRLHRPLWQRHFETAHPTEDGQRGSKDLRFGH